MPLMANKRPRGPIVVDTSSHLAGRMMVEGFEGSFRALRAFNFLADPNPQASLQYFKQAGHCFVTASQVYSGLIENVSDESLEVPVQLATCFNSALSIWENIGRQIIVESLSSPDASALRRGYTSLAALVRLARDTSGEAGQNLLRISISHTDSQMGRRLLADISVLQVLGISATEVMNEYG